MSDTESYCDFEPPVETTLEDEPTPKTAVERMVRAKRTQMFLEAIKAELDMMLKRMNSMDTAYEFAGLDELVGGIKTRAEILAGAYEARWPERALLMQQATGNVVWLDRLGVG